MSRDSPKLFLVLLVLLTEDDLDKVFLELIFDVLLLEATSRSSLRT